MKEPRDRSAELRKSADSVIISRNDYCSAYTEDTERLFTRRECWYCQFGDFGIQSDHPSQMGICRYREQTQKSPPAEYQVVSQAKRD